MIKNLTLLMVGIVFGWFLREVYIDVIPSSLSTVDVVSLEQIPIDFNQIDPEKIVEKVEVDNNTVVMLKAYLLNREYDLAFEIIESFRQLDNSRMVARSTDLIIMHGRQLISNNNYADAAKVLKRYLALFNRNIKIRMMLAEVYNRSSDYLLAIDELYIAKAHASIQTDINVINKKIRVLVKKQNNVFSLSKQYNKQLKLYEKLSQLEADYAPYFMGMAEAQIILGYFYAASSSLQMIVEDKDVGFQARELLKKVKKIQDNSSDTDSSEEDDLDNVSSVSLSRQGNHFYLNAFIDSTNSIKLLIDTGASITILTPQVLREFNQQLEKTGESRVFNTANGKVSANIYKLKALVVGEMKVSDIEVAVLEMQSSNKAEGLLGMNFLQYFKFYIDQDTNQLHLSLRNLGYE